MTRRKLAAAAWKVGVAAVVVGAAVIGARAHRGVRTDFEQDETRLRVVLAGFDDAPLAVDELAQLERCRRSLQLAGLTTEAADTAGAEQCLLDARMRFGASRALAVMEMGAWNTAHRFERVRRLLADDAELAASPGGRAVAVDLALEAGRLAVAEGLARELVADARSWSHLARLAHVLALTGDRDGADRLLEEAGGLLSSKEMRTFAWLEVQRGELDVQRGRLEDALVHFERAETAYSGWPLVGLHRAKALAGQRRLAESRAILQDLVSSRPLPELQHALGDVLALDGDRSARAWHLRARAGYLRTCERGDRQHVHHLATLLADSLRDADEAVAWAETDVAMRRNPATLEALAWARHLQGHHEEARLAIDEALAAGVVDARLYVRAAHVLGDAGQRGRAAELLDRALAINPRCMDADVH